MTLCKLIVIAALLAAEPPQTAAEPPALSEGQRAQLTQLVQRTQAAEAELKTQLASRQRELAAIYAAYAIDYERAEELEREIIRLQREWLASYREMQRELREIVDEERFDVLRRRLERVLQPTLGEAQEAAERQPQRPGANRPAADDGASDETPSEENDDEKIFSGPQPGEKLPAFKARGVLGAGAGEEIDFVARADGEPLVLIFVHEINRPTIGFARALARYCVSRAGDGLTTGTIFLAADVNEGEETLKRIGHALTPDCPTAVSLDGIEGPGAYGLNRNVSLTIIVANEGRATASFALVQPSLPTDLPRVVKAIVEAAGGEVPELRALLGEEAAMPARPMRPAANGANDGEENAAPIDMRALLGPVIRQNAAEADVDRAATEVERIANENAAAGREIGRIARAVVESGRLEHYGTAKAQEYLRKWAEKYGGAK